MPSPLPGMDPFLEDPAIFPDLHDGFIAALRAALQKQLPPPYYAVIGRRVWIEVTSRSVGPDVEVRRRTEPRTGSGTGATALADCPAVSMRASASMIVSVPHDEIRQPFLEIYAGPREGRTLVTSLEVLSPSNKAPGEQGRELYLRKQRELLASKTHLVEIDLLRCGTHTTAVPLERAVQVTGRFDYHVCVHRFDRFEDYQIYPILLFERLPIIEVPLLPDDPPVPCDLQQVFDRTYDEGPYEREIDYRSDPIVPPLREDQRERMRLLTG